MNGDPPLPHVAQRSRRDKLRFRDSDADAMLPPHYHDGDPDAFPARGASAADLGYLHAVVAPPPPRRRSPASEQQWPAPQYDASAWPWARPLKLEHDEDHGFATTQHHHRQQHHGARALSLTLSQGPYGGGSLQSVVGAAAGPLGPFTGYATVLKGSRFLKPAQQMLDEICAALGSSGSADAGGSYSLPSPSSLSSSSTDTGRDQQHIRPEFREKKAKLLYMQEEVCRSYKQYHQQMQMVVSSFESVPGLSSATPYASSVLRAISRHFRRIRSIISSQIQHISRVLGEELLSLPSCSRGGKAVARLGISEQSQPVWRPQRGLPERAVAVLRAWLFDHFLHPYPTDSEKHLLATQTGLSRNQVSNWFINARVRLWKPMVEEIHMLETRGSANACSSSDQAAQPLALPPLASHHQHQHQHQYQYLEQQWAAAHAHAQAQPMGVQAGAGAGIQVMGGFAGAAESSLADMGGGGFGPVLLTLGLRRDASYHQHQQQQLRGHVLGDIVG